MLQLKPHNAMTVTSSAYILEYHYKLRHVCGISINTLTVCANSPTL